MSGPEWKRGFLPATGAHGNRFLLGEPISRSLGWSPLLFACFAALGQILELFVVKEKLLAGSKYEILTAVDTLKHSVLEFHGIPFQPQLHNIAAAPFRVRTERISAVGRAALPGKQGGTNH